MGTGVKKLVIIRESRVGRTTLEAGWLGAIPLTLTVALLARSPPTLDCALTATLTSPPTCEQVPSSVSPLTVAMGVGPPATSGCV